MLMKIFIMTPGAPLTYSNDGWGEWFFGVWNFGQNGDFFWVYERCRDFIGSRKKQRDFLELRKKD